MKTRYVMVSTGVTYALAAWPNETPRRVHFVKSGPTMRRRKEIPIGHRVTK